MQSNDSELEYKYPTHLVPLEYVRREGSVQSNYPELM